MKKRAEDDKGKRTLPVIRKPITVTPGSSAHLVGFAPLMVGDALQKLLQQHPAKSKLASKVLGPGVASVIVPSSLPLAAHLKAPPTPIRSVGDLGRLVRDERKRRKLSQQAFADLIGVGRRFLSELENGKATLEMGKVLQVAAAAGLALISIPE